MHNAILINNLIMRNIHFFIKVLIVYLFITSNSLGAKSDSFSKGIEHFNKKEFDKSKIFFEKDIVFNPKNENSYLYLAKIYKIKKNDIMEESNLKTVILLNPSNEEAVRDLALLKIRKSNYSETEKLILDLKSICKKLCSDTSKLQEKLNNSLKN